MTNAAGFITRDQYEELHELELHWIPFQRDGWTYDRINDTRYNFTRNRPGHKTLKFYAVMDFENGRFHCVSDSDRIPVCSRTPGKQAFVTPKQIAAPVFEIERFKYLLRKEKSDL